MIARSRPVAFYTSTFGFGVALSIVAAGTVASELGWRAAFALAAVGPALAGAVVLLGLPAAPHAPAGRSGLKPPLAISTALQSPARAARGEGKQLGLHLNRT